MTKRPGARRRVQWKLERVGWRTARQMIDNEGYTLLKLSDGHAELLAPPSEVSGAKYRIKKGGEAYYFLTKRSVQLLEASRGKGPGIIR